MGLIGSWHGVLTNLVFPFDYFKIRFGGVDVTIIRFAIKIMMGKLISGSSKNIFFNGFLLFKFSHSET